MSRSFQEFCNRTATDEHVTEKIAPVCFADPEFEKRVNALCEIMQNKMAHLDRIHIPFIESKFEDMNCVAELLDSFYSDYGGQSLDYIVSKFSTRLYHASFHELTLEQQAIIKILSAYICISIQDK